MSSKTASGYRLKFSAPVTVKMDQKTLVPRISNATKIGNSKAMHNPSCLDAYGKDWTTIIDPTHRRQYRNVIGSLSYSAERSRTDNIVVADIPRCIRGKPEGDTHARGQTGSQLFKEYKVNSAEYITGKRRPFRGLGEEELGDRTINVFETRQVS